MRVCVPESPSIIVSSSIESVALSSLIMVPTPVLPPGFIVISFPGAVTEFKTTLKVSLLSTAVSPFTTIVMVWVSPIAPVVKLTVPPLPAKSVGALAVPFKV